MHLKGPVYGRRARIDHLSCMDAYVLHLFPINIQPSEMDESESSIAIECRHNTLWILFCV